VCLKELFINCLKYCDTWHLGTRDIYNTGVDVPGGQKTLNEYDKDPKYIGFPVATCQDMSDLKWIVFQVSTCQDISGPEWIAFRVPTGHSC